MEFKLKVPVAASILSRVLIDPIFAAIRWDMGNPNVVRMEWRKEPRVAPERKYVNESNCSTVLCTCGSEMTDILKPLIQDGKIARELPGPQDIRGYVLDQLAREIKQIG